MGGNSEEHAPFDKAEIRSAVEKSGFAIVGDGCILRAYLFPPSGFTGALGLVCGTLPWGTSSILNLSYWTPLPYASAPKPSFACPVSCLVSLEILRKETIHAQEDHM